MIIKSSSLMYLFSFDATIIRGDLSGYERGLSQIMSPRILFSPDEFDIRWTILTSRPKIELPLISLQCKRHKLYPSQIITGPFLFKRFKCLETIWNYKLDIIKKILEKKYKVYYTNDQVTKIIYISNTVDEIKYLNANSSHYPFMGITVADFYTQIFNNSI